MSKENNWQDKLKWRNILLEKNINLDDCIQIDNNDKTNPTNYTIYNNTLERVEYVDAKITSDTVLHGESTGENAKLAREVRNDGKPGDDAGHIIGAQLGGRMDRKNLIPQPRDINRGFYKGLNQYWAMNDNDMAQFLKNDPASVIKVQYSMIYDDKNDPKRPIEIHVLGKVISGEGQIVWMFEYVAPNEIENKFLQTKGQYFKQSGKCKEEELEKLDDDDDHERKNFLANLKKYKKDCIKNSTKEEKKNNSANRKKKAVKKPIAQYCNTNKTFESKDIINLMQQTSVRTAAGFIPLVGPALSICDAVKDFADGRLLQGVGNLSLAAVSGTLDVLTLASLGTTAPVAAVLENEGKKILKDASVRLVDQVSVNIFGALVKANLQRITLSSC